MTLMEAIYQRHSVRRYIDKPIAPDAAAALLASIAQYNRESGLHIQLVQNEPKAFSGFLAHYGLFTGVRSYIALVGTPASDLEEACGYYGQRLVLQAQQLGLNTCWTALTYKKIPGAFDIAEGEKLVIVIAVGYGENTGRPHRSRSAAQVSRAPADAPDWFRRGVEAALLAPTAINQQRFLLTYVDGGVKAKALPGPCSRIDLGIVKCHFEIGAGKENFIWT